MVAAVVALAALGLAFVGLVTYLVRELVAAQRKRDADVEAAEQREAAADKRFRDELAVAETYLKERNDANAKRAETDAELRILTERISRMGIVLRNANELLSKGTERQLASGDVAAVTASVTDLLRTPLPDLSGATHPAEAAAAGGDPTATTVRIAPAAKPDRPAGDSDG